MEKIYLLVANYEKYDFKKLYEEAEEKEYPGILWRNSRKIDIKKGDIVYIYYSNMPDGIKRILIKSEVLEVPEEKQKFEYLGKDIEDYVFYIAGIEKYKSKNLFKALFPEQTERFSSKELMKKYNIPFNSSTYIYEIKNKELIEELEKTVNNPKETKSFTQLKTLFQDFKCQYTKRKHEESEYFGKRNGLKYYEVHHFMMQSVLKRYKLEENEIDKIRESIYTPSNEIFLCPNCHMRIHHANEQEVKKMLDFFYEKENIKNNVNKTFNILRQMEKIEQENAKEWLYEMYNIHYMTNGVA